MPALIEPLPPFLLACAPTAVAAGATLGVPWSSERVLVMQQEAVARLHYGSSVSAQARDAGVDEHEFRSIPLVPTRTVRVRFRHVGPLPPMSLEDEAGTSV